MSYEFTKLGAVEALTEMPENANALVEVDGAIKRVPASVGGGSGVLMIHATIGDLDMSDPSAYTAPCTMDKTYAEIAESIGSGSFAVCEADISGAKFYLPVLQNGGGAMIFGIQLGTTAYMVNYGENDDALFIGQSTQAE